jgi:hypothetical protein
VLNNPPAEHCAPPVDTAEFGHKVDAIAHRTDVKGGMNDAMEWDLKSFSYDWTFGHFSRMLLHVKD